MHRELMLIGSVSFGNITRSCPKESWLLGARMINQKEANDTRLVLSSRIQASGEASHLQESFECCNAPLTDQHLGFPENISLY
ncbi:hypothetical protein P5673_008415 [Acropora cervicornis]|uniref:Uncharacterized protein n=1 Tax=Acropora cervicornis TaxID=6130 RepID=A0AAD9QU33_ACRCE|nr:hypothetical protein P5673_008415 [Acropora cervicornis]